VVTSGSGHFAIRQGPWVFIDYPIGGDVKEPAWYQADRDYHPHQFPGELYNLQQDPPERNDPLRRTAGHGLETKDTVA
jgi:hypothetical protein